MKNVATGKIPMLFNHDYSTKHWREKTLVDVSIHQSFNCQTF